MPREISINYGYGYAFQTSGGGPGSPPLVAGANPPAQYAAAGTTTLVFGFPAASGGASPITYSPPSLAAPPGSTATVSGTAPGNITVNNAADDESYLIRVYATDANGQQVLNDAIGAIAGLNPPSLVAGVNPAAQYAPAGTSSLIFAFPAATGGFGVISYSPPDLTAPPGSTATVSGTAPGNITINGASDGESYLVRVYATDADGQQVLTDAIGAIEPAPLVPLAEIVPPAWQLLSSTTTSASATFTQPGAPAGMVYAASAHNVTTGATVTITSGSELGPYVFPVEDGNEYILILKGTATDGQVAQAVAEIAVQAIPELAWADPAPASGPAGTTSLDITWATPTGGVPPYTYSSAATLLDTQGEFTTAILSTTSPDPGVTTASGLVDGQSIVISRSVTDAAGSTQTVTATIAVNPGAASLSLSSSPASQTISGFSSSVNIGSWGSPIGGTGPYTYVVTDTTGGSVVSGTGLGDYSATGLSAGQSYIYRMEVTDSLGAKGYGYTTVSVENIPPGWILEDDVDLTSADWTAFSSTATTVSTTNWYGIVYKADGVTPGLYLRNNVAADARFVDLSPSGLGLRLVAGSGSANPTLGVWPAGWTSFLNGSRNDVFLVAAIVSGVNVAGTSSFSNIVGLCNRDTPASPLTGLRVTNSSTTSNVRAASYVSTFTEQLFQSFPTGAKRAWGGEVQISIADFRRQTIYFNANSTSFNTVESGQRVKGQSPAAGMSTPGGLQSSTADWGDATINRRTCFELYDNRNAAPTSPDEGVFLKKIRLYRLPGGSR